MVQVKPFIVGRQAEIALFATLLQGATDYQLLNIYGPGGIGKTIVGERMAAHAQEQKIPVAVVDGNRSDLTPDRMLYHLMEGLVKSSEGEALAAPFKEFDRQFQDYLIVNQVLQQGGGIQKLFDVVGNVQDPTGFAAILGGLGSAVSSAVQNTVRNRFALERYLRGVEKVLTKAFMEGLEAGLVAQRTPVALLIDTYEEMEGLDDWVCRTLVPGLPEGARLVILGRNQVHKVNFDWNELENSVHALPLPELAEADAKTYLRHFGLSDAVALDKVYQFTGGYPLLLVLVRHLAKEAGGWENIGTLESTADRDRVASQLLERILRQESVAEVQAFLEKGVIARWFDPETIHILLEVNLADARTIYDKLSRHSFVERHPYGLKFHDKIRELLLDRLKFTSEHEYNRLAKRLQDYYARKAGIQPEAESAANQEGQTPIYHIHIENSQGIVIGEGSKIEQRFNEQEKPNNSYSDHVKLRLDAAVPQNAFLNHPFEMAVAVRQPSSPLLEEDDLPLVRSGEAQVIWQKSSPYIRLQIQVSALGCKIEGKDTISFQLFDGTDSPIFYFVFTPITEGRIAIIVKLFQEEDWLGSTRITTIVKRELVSEVHIETQSTFFTLQFQPHRQNPQGVIAVPISSAPSVNLRSLRDVLVELYPDEISTRRVVADAQLPSSTIDFHGNAINVWFVILTEAQKHQGGLSRLIETVNKEYHDNALFNAILQAYLVEQPKQSEL